MVLLIVNVKVNVHVMHYISQTYHIKLICTNNYISVVFKWPEFTKRRKPPASFTMKNYYNTTSSTKCSLGALNRFPSEIFTTLGRINQENR